MKAMKLFTPRLLVLPNQAIHRDVISQKLSRDQECVWANQEDENLSIELVRSLQEKIQYQVITKLRVVAILHLESASLAAQQALLKTLEEPPADTQLYLTATQLGVVLETIQSRCLIDIFDPANQEETIRRGQELYQLIRSASIPDILALSSEYGQKVSAEGVCQDLIAFLQQHLSRQPEDTQAVTHCRYALQSLELLSKNISPRLVLEDMWFSLYRMR